MGGPNETADDEPVLALGVRDLPPSMIYADHIDSYSTNEVTINWNAPLAFMATWLSAHEPDAPAPTTTTTPEAIAPTDPDEPASDQTWALWLLLGGLTVGVATALLRR